MADATRRHAAAALLASLVAALLAWRQLGGARGEPLAALPPHAPRVPLTATDQASAFALLQSFAASSRSPAVFTQSPIVQNWTALRSWDPQRLAAALPRLPQVCIRPAHQDPLFVWEDIHRPFGRRLGVRVAAAHAFDRDAPAADFFSAPASSAARAPPRVHHLYLSAKLHHEPYASHMAADAEPRAFLSAPADLPELHGQDANLFAGEAGTVAHTHYDTTHGVFAQVHGTKRFELWPPEAYRSLRLHPHGHPGHRQSQLMPTDVEDWAMEGPPAVAAPEPTEGLRTGAAAAGAAASPSEHPAAALQAVLHPGEMLYLPPFWFHRVTSLSFSVGLSVSTDSREGERFDQACRAGLPSALMDTKSPLPVRAAAAQRFLLGELLRRAVPDGPPTAYVRRAIVEDRFAPLAAPLGCAADADAAHAAHADAATAGAAAGGGKEGDEMAGWCAPPCEVGLGGGGLGGGSAGEEEAEIAARVHAALAGGDASTALDAVGLIQLEDYVQHVAAFAVGEARVCRFLTHCLAVPPAAHGASASCGEGSDARSRGSGSIPADRALF